MGNIMVLENYLIPQMIQFMKDFLIMITIMEKVFYIKMEKKYSKVILKMVNMKILVQNIYLMEKGKEKQDIFLEKF